MRERFESFFGKHFTPAVIIIVVLLCILAFGRTLKLGFIWDDHQMIESSPFIKAWTFKNLAHHFTSDPFNQNQNYYRPLQSISNAADFSLWKLNPAGYHLTNLALHMLNAILVFLLFLKLTNDKRMAAIVSMAFAVNPMVVEQLIVIAGRAEIMAATFTLLSVYLFLFEKPSCLLLSLASFVLAMLSKESGAATPFLLLSVAIYRKELPKKYPYLAIFFFLLLPYFYLRHYALNQPLVNNAHIIAQKMLLLPKVLAVYVYNTILPLNLHSHRLQPLSGPDSVFFWIIFIAAIYLLIRIKKPLVAFFAAWYLILFAPKLPLLFSQDLMLDHWAYLSNAGLFALIALCAEYLLSRHLAVKKPVYTILLLFAVFYIAESNNNITARGSDIKIYEHAVKYTTSTPVHYNLAREYYLNGNLEKSIKYFRIVLSRAPDNILYLNGYALALSKAGKNREAVTILDDILAKDPSDKQTLYNRAVISYQKNDRTGAARMLEKVISQYPDYEKAYLLLEHIYLTKKEKEKAAGVLKKLLEVNPNNFNALLDLGSITAEKGDYKLARELFSRANSISPDNPVLKENIRKIEACTK